MGDRFTTPVVLLIYKRPELTQQVLGAIAQACPSRLLVVGDGPHPERPEEAEKVAAARAVIEGIDWDCQVETNYAEANLGLRGRVSSGLTWAFEQVEEAIILEDDCLPDITFFRFCQELLERYRYDERLAVVSGDNFQGGHRRTPYSYYFSRYNHCWGWACWRRAWQWYDDGMQSWPEKRQGNWLADIFDGDQAAARYWVDIFDRVYVGQIDSWAYPWTFSCWAQGALTALPNANLVSNIGFGAEATHTRRRGGGAFLPTEAMEFPLRHPPSMIREARADQHTQDYHFGTGRFARAGRLWARIVNGMRGLFLAQRR